MAKAILVVDDSALIRKQLGNLLDRAGYDVGFAKNGLEAVEFVKEYDFDCITMDINMPVMDGLSAVKEIMKIKPTPSVMVSSLTQDEADITFEALDLGAVDYVPKPGTITLDIRRQEEEILQKAKALIVAEIAFDPQLQKELTQGFENYVKNFFAQFGIKIKKIKYKNPQEI